MSMSTCKCGKVFDSDFEMSHDEKGNCCCDECDKELYEGFVKDLESIGNKFIDAEEIANHLMELGYRKIK